MHFYITKPYEWKSGSDTTVTESVPCLKVQPVMFYPCPHSCKRRAAWSTLSSNPAAPPVCSTDCPSTGWGHPCTLGAAPGAAGQGSHTSCSCHSQTEHYLFTDAMDHRQFLPNGPISHTTVCVWGAQLLSSQINLLPQAVFETTQIPGILQRYGLEAHIPALLLPLPWETFAAFCLMAHLNSMIRTPPPSTSLGRGSSTSALGWAAVLPDNTASVLPGGATQHWEKPQKPC